MRRILITGGNGCLGQHIIKLIQENVDNIDQIRVLDLQTFDQKIEYTRSIPIFPISGSITDETVLDEATTGVNCVIHTAAYVDVKLFPDHERLDLVNRKGTQLLLEACYKNNVEVFIHCSTLDVVLGFQDIINGNEQDPTPDKLLFGSYARSKQAAENAVLKMNGRILSNGCVMRTVALRPLILYGELDQHFVSEALKASVQNGKMIVDFCGKGSCCFQYVGNTAWAFVCAYKAMTSNVSLGGEAFVVKDNTPAKSMIQFVKPYFEAFDITVYRSFVPYWILYLLIYFIHIILILISPIKKFQFPLTISTLIFTNLRLTFDGKKAETILKYKPKYNSNESFKRSLNYYRSLDFLNKKQN